MADPTPPSVLHLEYRGRVAIITIDNDAKLNSLGQLQYYELAQKLREIATHDEVYITVLLGKGRYFSAGADVSAIAGQSDAQKPPPPDDKASTHQFWLKSFAAFNLNATDAFATHPKILVVGLNGPAVGLSAALISFADFVYAAPHAFLLTPFSSLGLVAEGGASRALVQRLGPGKANEALLMSRRVPVGDLVHVGFVNKVFDVARGDDARFRAMVLAEVEDKLGEHLNGESLVGIKALIRAPEVEVLEKQNVREVFAGMERFMKGVPQEEFAKIASGAKRHKL